MSDLELFPAERDLRCDHGFAHVVSSALRDGLIPTTDFEFLPHSYVPLAASVACLEPEAEKVLRDHLTRVHTCLRTIIHAYRGNAELRAFLAVPAEDLVLADPKPSLDFCRFDLQGNRLGEVRIIEFNGGETILGPLTTGLLARYWRETPTVGALLDRWQAPESVSEGDTWLVDELLSVADAERIAVVTPAMAHDFVEFEVLKRQARLHDRVVFTTEPPDVDADLGVLVYPTSSVIRNRDAWTPMFDRVLAGDLALPNELAGRLIGSNKLCLAVMSDPRFRGLFTPEDAESIAALVPWSRKLGDGAEVSEVIAGQADLVLKDPYGAIGQSVHIGRECEPERWRELVQRCDGWLVQEHVAAQRVGPFLRTMGVGFCGTRIVGYTGLLSRHTVTNSRFGPGGGIHAIIGGT
ncbi:hypothetical protein Lesp02_35260 [Lentzea sp. NBRC 105346]|uniref:hypothetical protein n=1 Tax=Lentzea sp. NBRC 105346 TaxID=3032205 RepID=UPI0024A1EEDB|nr:hypothetical protein [Lentzea sp. NBRC 105346]GLZ31338.1 hypothetical protein Lesp02_35260 [Lentzea sp. NBRC 105346]